MGEVKFSKIACGENFVLGLLAAKKRWNLYAWGDLTPLNLQIPNAVPSTEDGSLIYTSPIDVVRGSGPILHQTNSGGFTQI